MNEEMNNNYNNTPNYNYEKKNNGVKVLYIILILLVLFLSGLTAYKILVFDKPNNNIVDNNEVNKINEYNSISDYIKNNEGLLTDNDDAFIIDTKSIEEKKCDGNSFILTNNGLNVEAKCVMSKYDLGTSYAYDITAKNNKVITVKSGCSSCGCTNLYSNNNYIIEFHNGCSINGQRMIIYNLNDGEKIYYAPNYFEESDKGKPYLATSSGKYGLDIKSHGVVFSKNNLYYVLAYPNAVDSSNINAKCKLIKVDLSNSEFIETEIDSMDCYYWSDAI